MNEGDGLRATIASIAGPTCPVCWPGVTLAQDVAAWHRRWHSLRTDWLMAHARLQVSGLPSDVAALDAARFALADFEVQHPELTAPSGHGKV